VDASQAAPETQKLRADWLQDRLDDVQRKWALSLEFGFSPMIVEVVERQATRSAEDLKDEFAWRFVKSDRELAYLLLSIIKIESGGNVRAYNADGQAFGLTQMQLPTAQTYRKNINADDLYNVQTHLELASTHLKALLKKYHGNAALAVIAWNRGSGSVDRLIALGSSPENGYANRVFRAALATNVRE
jgi:soluble lytic murein transglycosylase-like protein